PRGHAPGPYPVGGWRIMADKDRGSTIDDQGSKIEGPSSILDPRSSIPLTVWTLPVLPLKNTVLFPHLFMPLAAGRPASVAAVEAALAGEEKTLILLAQRDGNVEQPAADQLYTVGTRAVVKKMARSEGTIELIVQGIERVTVLKVEQIEPYLQVRASVLSEPDDNSPEVEALYRAVLELATRALQIIQPQAEVSIQQVAAQANNPMHL